MSRFIVLYNYNKYYNRIIKKLNTYEEYKALITPLGSTPAQYHGLEVTSVNFNYEDGVFAKHVINIPRGYSSFYNFHEPDYLVLERTYKDGDQNVTEVSRWFVLETQKTRGNQLELSLKRDLLADYFNEVCSAPVFIEKGNPISENDPAIFNRESMTYNQIKKREYKLDMTNRSGKGGGWIVGYIAKEETPTDIGPCVGQAEVPAVVPSYDELPALLRQCIEAGSALGYYPTDFYMRFFAKFVMGNTTEYRRYLIFHTYSSGVGAVHDYPDPSGTNLGYPKFLYSSTTEATTNAERQIREAYQTGKTVLGLLSKVNTWYSSLTGLRFSLNEYSPYSSYNNLIYIKDGKYYRLKIKRTSSTPIEASVSFTVSQVKSQSSDLSSGFKNFVQNYLINGTNIVENTEVNNDSYAVTFSKRQWNYSFTAEEIDYDEVKVTLKSTRNKNIDAPYDIFCIPLGEVSVYSSGGSLLFTQAGGVAEAIARAIAIKGGQKIYDIQILPYCPFDEMLTSNGDITLAGFTVDKDYSYITKANGGTTVGIVLYAKHCRGTFDISLSSINGPAVSKWLNEQPEDIVYKKIFSETSFVRFVSPNFASTFDINVQKNKGILTLNVDYFYKPYSPYIHVAPYFSGLYGEDFNDPKGLICSGEFSIATAQSQWENYQIQNKNYELIFNRQIQNLDVNNSIAYDVQKITAGIGQGTSLLTGLAGGAVAGSMIGGPIGTAVGAVAGAIGGGVLSGVGAKYDLEYLKKSQVEARSYAVDMYGYSLGNVKALPYTLTRVSTFTENNKIFPFLEFYDCTDEEREALRNKIKYNGMTIMRVGKISDFIWRNYRYVQGQLIRLDGIDEDSHVIAEIANEIKLGGYYYGTDTIEP